VLVPHGVFGGVAPIGGAPTASGARWHHVVYATTGDGGFKVVGVAIVVVGGVVAGTIVACVDVGWRSVASVRVQ
jgi:hypothetical protein